MTAASEAVRLAWMQAWQVTLTVAAVALLVRLAAHHRPHLAHALWLVVLVKCLTPPLWSSPSGVFCWLQHEASSRSAARPSAPQAARRTGPGDLMIASMRRDPRLWNSRAVSVSVPTAPATAVSAAAADGWISLHALLGSLWLAGMTTMAVVAVCRCLCCLRRVKRSRCENDPELELAVRQLSQRLGLRRRVRLLVARCPVGPAVVGLFRPTIVLPAVVVAGRTAADLEPIVAHELLHVRRGDLWIGALQTLAQAVWWFHPLVWLANRLASRETERCCDEAVVAELGCSPSRYARCLLHVLELKQSLQSVPAFPGVKPVEVTSRRLERIMSLGQGSLKRTPWWCWAAMLVLAAATLPGAALVLSARAEPPAAEPLAAEPMSPAPGPPEPATRAQQQFPVDVVWPAAPPAENAKAEIQLQIETRITTGPPQVIDANCHRWTVRPAELVDVEDAEQSAPGQVSSDGASGDTAPGSQAHYSVDKELPVLYEIMDQPRAQQVLDLLLAEATVNTNMAPKVRLLNGHTATIINGTLRPFVVGVRDGQPRVRTIREGIVMRLKPLADPDGRLRLDCRLTLSKVRGVETVTVSRGDQEPLELQIPEVATTQLATQFELPLDRTLLIGGLKTKDGEEHDQAVLVMLRVSKVEGSPAKDHGESTSSVLRDTGVNSDAGITGSVKLTEPAHESQAGELADQQARAFLGTWSVRNLPRSAHLVVESSTSGGMTQTVCKGGVRLSLEPEQANRLPDTGNRAILVEADEAILTSPAGGAGDLLPEGACPSLSLKGNVRLKFGACIATCEHAVLETAAKQRPEPQTEGTPAAWPVRFQLEGDVRVRRGTGRQASVLVAERVCFLSAGDSDYRIQADGVRSMQPLVLKRYPVADLVVPTGQYPIKISAGGEQAGPSQLDPSKVDFDALIELITTTIAPQSWSEVGGGGVVETHRPTLSLVIHQESAVHEQIGDLLAQIRRLQDVQVTIQVETIATQQEIRPDLAAAVGQALTEEKAAALRKQLAQEPGVQMAEGPRLTLLNGQPAELPLPPCQDSGEAGPRLQLVPFVSPDRREVRFHWAIGAKDALDAIAKSNWLATPDGHSRLVELTEPIAAASAGIPLLDNLPHFGRLFRNEPRGRVLLMITPRIVVQEEQEEAFRPEARESGK